MRFFLAHQLNKEVLIDHLLIKDIMPNSFFIE